MNLKHMKFLKIASVINLLLGSVLIIMGLLEFTNIMETKANTVIESVGVQLSYLVFISGILVFVSGGVSLINRKNIAGINLQILLGVIALAWPVFVSISLFFSQLFICIRLLPTMMSALFYVIAVLIVKITNEALKKTHKFNPKGHFETAGKRNSGVDISRVFNSNTPTRKARPMHKIQSLGSNASGKRKNILSVFRILQSPGKRRSGKNFNFLYAGAKHRRGRFKLRK